MRMTVSSTSSKIVEVKEACEDAKKRDGAQSDSTPITSSGQEMGECGADHWSAVDHCALGLLSEQQWIASPSQCAPVTRSLCRRGEPVERLKARGGWVQCSSSDGPQARTRSRPGARLPMVEVPQRLHLRFKSVIDRPTQTRR